MPYRNVLGGPLEPCDTKPSPESLPRRLPFDRVGVPRRGEVGGHGEVGGRIHQDSDAGERHLPGPMNTNIAAMVQLATRLI